MIIRKENFKFDLKHELEIDDQINLLLYPQIGNKLRLYNGRLKTFGGVFCKKGILYLLYGNSTTFKSVVYSRTSEIRAPRFFEINLWSLKELARTNKITNAYYRTHLLKTSNGVSRLVPRMRAYAFAIGYTTVV